MSQINHIRSQIKSPVQTTDYLIGSNLLANLHKIEKLKSQNFSTFLLLSDTIIFKLYGEKVMTSLKKLGKAVTTSVIKPGEKQKKLSAISHIVKPYFEAGFDRNSCLVALGGGVITDLGGFIASILLRGINCMYLPTTLLGQIDAAIGGKTGVDYMIDGHLMFKNMIGTIYQPQMVISDVDTLTTLPDKEIRNGLGEMVKYWLGWGKPNPRHLAMVKKTIKTRAARWMTENDKHTPGVVLRPRHTPGVEESKTLPMVEELVKTVSLCQKIKIEIVQQDPLETKGIRQKLNLGHTIGHAIEGALDGKLSHGQAVAVGLLAAARISAEKKMMQEDTLLAITNTLATLGLPSKIRASQYSRTRLNLISAVNKALKLDKKAGKFVLIRDIGQIESGVKVEKKIIQEVLKEVVA